MSLKGKNVSKKHKTKSINTDKIREFKYPSSYRYNGEKIKAIRLDFIINNWRLNLTELIEDVEERIFVEFEKIKTEKNLLLLENEIIVDGRGDFVFRFLCKVC
jgi:hypothetical protein